MSGVAMPWTKKHFTPPLQCLWHGVSFTHQFLFLPEAYTPILGQDLLSRVTPCIIVSFLNTEDNKDSEGETEDEDTDCEALVTAQVDKHLWEDDLPGLPVTATPVRITLKYPNLLWYNHQQSLDPKGKAGLQPLIGKFLKCGLLKLCMSPCNSPIRAVKKGNEYRLVQNLKELNKALTPIGPVESNPRKILGEIPPHYCWFTVFNVKFCIPLDEASQYLFAFEWTDQEGRPQQLTWTVVPQGFRDTAHHLAETLTRDLGDLVLDQGKVLHYFNDILICSPTKELATCHAVQTLNFFAKRGYKASRSKLQLVTQKVRYMGLVLTPGKQSLSHERVKAISCLSRPTTKSELRAVLGKMGFCRRWIVCYGLKAKPLYAALKGEGCLISWGQKQDNAFEQLKQEILRAPALALPRMDTPFQLFGTELEGIALGVLTQPLGPVAYLSQQLDPVAQGWPEDLRALAAAAILIEEASKLSLGQLLEVFSPYPLAFFLEAPRTLTNKRLRKYRDLMLENPKVTLHTCGPLNLSSLLPEV